MFFRLSHHSTTSLSSFFASIIAESLCFRKSYFEVFSKPLQQSAYVCKKDPYCAFAIGIFPFLIITAQKQSLITVSVQSLPVRLPAKQGDRIHPSVFIISVYLQYYNYSLLLRISKSLHILYIPVSTIIRSNSFHDSILFHFIDVMLYATYCHSKAISNLGLRNLRITFNYTNYLISFFLR